MLSHEYGSRSLTLAIHLYVMSCTSFSYVLLRLTSTDSGSYSAPLEQMESDCDAALQQIEEKMYARECQDEYDHILCYGIAFYKKRCLVKTI